VDHVDNHSSQNETQGHISTLCSHKIKAAVWALMTLLTTMFASRVVPVMPPAVGAVVWVMAVTTTAGGFWAFFLNP
jgi:hypothetical protein